ncbi:MAG TPA: protoporphyrinogen oxidase HemJ [Nevskiaceae bacterium]|nr:protoporphyrinogen oxidase HemJ [Nevskiaceae bacterium]
MTLYLWTQALHVIFMVTWFAGLFYLPRLFVYHADTRDEPGHQRFVVMEQRLYAITLIGMVLTWVFGLALLWQNPGLMKGGWMHAKLTLVILLSGYFGFLGASRRRFARGENRLSARAWRWLNEVPALVLVAVVILAVGKPF